MKRLLSNDDFIDGFLTGVVVLTLFLLMFFGASSGYAQLPETGSLGIKSTGVGTDRSISLAVDGNETGNKSLLDLCATAGVSPCSILAFRGWPSVPVPGPVSNTIAEKWIQTISNCHVGFSVSWDASNSGGEPTHFRIERSVNGGPYTFRADHSAVLGNQFFDIRTHPESTLQPSTQYSYRVTPVNDTGDGGSATTNTVETRAAPTAATNLVVSNNYPNGVSFTWTPGLRNDIYWVEYYFDGVPQVNNGTPPYSGICRGTPDYTVTPRPSLTPGTKVKFQVTAFNEGGLALSVMSSEVTYEPLDPPGVPRDLVATKGEISWTVSWQPPSTGGPVNIYRLQVDLNDSGNWGLQQTTSSTSVNIPAIPGNTYRFRVRAENAGGVSDWVQYDAGPF